jgi:hypothetical protein
MTLMSARRIDKTYAGYLFHCDSMALIVDFAR